MKPVLQLIEKIKVNAISHITGGGIPENLVRVLNDGIDAHVDMQTWERPAIFNWLQEHGNVAEPEMQRTFNCGIGMMVVVPADMAEAAVELLNAAGEDARVIGEITAGSGQVHTS